MNLKESFYGFLVLLMGIFIFILCPLGWLINLFWTFHQTLLSNVIIGVLGIFAFPIGILHGLYLLACLLF